MTGTYRTNANPISSQRCPPADKTPVDLSTMTKRDTFVQPAACASRDEHPSGYESAERLPILHGRLHAVRHSLGKCLNAFDPGMKCLQSHISIPASEDADRT